MSTLKKKPVPVPKKKAAPKKPKQIKVLPKKFTFMPTAKAAESRLKRLQILRKKIVKSNGSHWGTPEFQAYEKLEREQKLLLAAVKKGPKATVSEWEFIEEVEFDD